ncbi:MAG: BON domain-containing protein [Verrucomicrobiota bacterium]|jgi:osmotically-inducible protein OsmY
MKTDLELKKDILAELAYEPSINAADIGVLVKQGGVLLNGSVSSYAAKLAAAHAAKRVAGVKGVADEIVVHLPDSSRRTDDEIAAAAAKLIDWIITVPTGAVTVTVRDGWLTLKGVVEWAHQKNAAEEAVQRLTGVKGINNLIIIRPKQPTPSDVNTAIMAAFERHALLDAQKIAVETSGSKVVLRGTLGSCLEREEAERAARSAPGVSEVENRIIIHVW